MAKLNIRTDRRGQTDIQVDDNTVCLAGNRDDPNGNGHEDSCRFLLQRFTPLTARLPLCHAAGS